MKSVKSEIEEAIKKGNKERAEIEQQRRAHWDEATKKIEAERLVVEDRKLAEIMGYLPNKVRNAVRDGKKHLPLTQAYDTSYSNNTQTPLCRLAQRVKTACDLEGLKTAITLEESPVLRRGVGDAGIDYINYLSLILIKSP